MAYHNEVRPHRARGRLTPRAAFDARDKAGPGPGMRIAPGTRVRQDRVDGCGKLSLRYRGRLHHIGVGREHRHRQVFMLVAGLEVRVVTTEGELIHQLIADPSRD